MSDNERQNWQVQQDTDFIRQTLEVTGCTTREQAIKKLQNLTAGDRYVMTFISKDKYELRMPPAAPNANQRQVGGSHYQSGHQHWDIMTNNYGPTYLIGCATKYVTRARKKNGPQDVEKSLHYQQKLLEYFMSGGAFPPQVPTEVVLGFIMENQLTALEGAICLTLFQLDKYTSVNRAIELTQKLLEQVRATDALGRVEIPGGALGGTITAVNTTTTAPRTGAGGLPG